MTPDEAEGVLAFKAMWLSAKERAKHAEDAATAAERRAETAEAALATERNRALATARNRALEEAAEIAMREGQTSNHYGIRDAILALRTEETK